MRRKKVMVITVISILMIVISVSYASFVVSTESMEASRLLISNMMYRIDIKGTGGSEVIKGREITLGSGNTIIVEV